MIIDKPISVLKSGLPVCLFALIVDYVDWSHFLSEKVAGACDTIVGHGGIAGIIWFCAFGASVMQFTQSSRISVLNSCWNAIKKHDSVISLLLCIALGMFMDMDHFIFGKYSIFRHTWNENSRPPGHSVLFLCASVFFLWLICLYFSLPLHFPHMLFTAWGSHQLRDAIRRGLWLWPLDYSIPVNYFAYLLVLFLFPYFLSICTNVSLVTSARDRRVSSVDLVNV